MQFSRLNSIKRTPPVKKWNIKKPGGWNKYEFLFNKYASQINKLIEECSDINNLVYQINKIDDKIKFMAFGKTKIKNYRINIVKPNSKISNNDILKIEKSCGGINEQ